MLLLPTLFAALAAAASTPKRALVAKASTSNAVRLKARFNPSEEGLGGIDNMYVHSIHVGAGYDYASLNEDNGLVFFKNAAFDDPTRDVLINSWPPMMFNFKREKEDGGRQIMITSSDVNYDVQIVNVDGSLSLGPATWAACLDSPDEYPGQAYTMLKNFEDASRVPQNCATVTLVPYCAELPDFPQEATNAGLNFEPKEMECYE
ncbi:hypothetical protein BROUX41_000003 [Berkeleyomyces rouxiae]|uniref:uncharacterized protein n=1 Tax=Berkeleyomyces rouxiae TaxID=2035830 RepID=UPI003B7D036C